MLRRLPLRALVPLLLLALVVVAGSTAVAKSPKASKKATIEMKGKITFKPNKFIKDTASFSPRDAVIRSGGKLTLKNRQDEPHTFSIVQKSDLAGTLKKLLSCGEPGTICDKIFTGHKPDADGNPTVPIVDVGKPGIDQVGDSIILNPKQTQKVDVSLAKGKSLYFMCGIHAWMQGELKSR
jgi:hypothetical protein